MNAIITVKLACSDATQVSLAADNPRVQRFKPSLDMDHSPNCIMQIADWISSFKAGSKGPDGEQGK